MPRELIPLAGIAGARVEMHLRDLKTRAGPEHKLAVRAVDAAGNRGPEATATIRLSTRVPGRLPELKPVAGPTARSSVLPRIGGVDVAIIDELDKVNPATGELIPAQAKGYEAANHLWDAADRRVTLQAARNEFVAFQVMLRGDSLSGSIKGELVFDGAEARQFRLRWNAIIPCRRGEDRCPTPSCR